MYLSSIQTAVESSLRLSFQKQWTNRQLYILQTMTLYLSILIAQSVIMATWKSEFQLNVSILLFSFEVVYRSTCRSEHSVHFACWKDSRWATNESAIQMKRMFIIKQITKNCYWTDAVYINKQIGFSFTCSWERKSFALIINFTIWSELSERLQWGEHDN